MSAASVAVRQRPDRLSTAGLIIVGVCAIAVSAGTLYELARYAGWAWWTAPMLPSIVSVYAVTTVRIYLAGHTRSARVRDAARRQAVAAVGAELAGNGLAHLLHDGTLVLGTCRWILVLAVALVAPAAVGGLVHLVSLRARDDEFASAETKASGGAEDTGTRLSDRTESPGEASFKTTRSVPPNAKTTLGTSAKTIPETTATAARHDQPKAGHGTTKTTSTTTAGTGRGGPQETQTGTGSRHGPRPAAPKPPARGENQGKNPGNPRDRTENHLEDHREYRPARRPRNVLAFDPQRRAEAVAAYRASVTAGEPLSERALAARFGLSKTWARNRIAEASRAGKPADAATGDCDGAPTAPARRDGHRTASDLATEARVEAEAIAAYRASADRGQPLSTGALAECYDQTPEWARRIIAQAACDQPVDGAEPVRTKPQPDTPLVRLETAAGN